MELPEVETSLKHMYFVSWEQLQLDALALAHKLRTLENSPIAVIAISRGGLIPAAIVAYELKIKYIDTYCITSYTDQHQQTSSAALKRSQQWDSNRVVVIDDLVDTGDTLALVKKQLPNCHYASVYAKPKGKSSVDTYVEEVSQDTWIYFPWEGISV